jgi:glucose uptake protein
MFIVHDLNLAILLCVITMLGWGSWANTQKLAGKEKWPFQLFYWDYAIGVLLFGAIFALTLGNAGSVGMGSIENLASASGASVRQALFSGALFNLSNILLVVAIDAAGMTVAFPVGVGLALVIGTVASYLQTPKGDPGSLFAGVGLVVLAMVLSAMAYRKLPRKAEGGSGRGLLFAIVAGCLMGLFYPQLMSSISPDFNTSPIRAGMLTPYTGLLLFGSGVFLSNILINMVFMRAAGLQIADYTRGSFRLHGIGILGGMIWMLALCLNVIASGVAGPAVSYALGQGATLVAAVWGVFVWKEFKGAPSSATPLIASMFLGYALGLFLIGRATL